MATVIAFDGSLASMMKRLQPDMDVKRLWERRYPLLARVRKVGDFFGSQMDVPLEHDHPSASRDFTTAAGNAQQPSSSVKYNLTRAKDYGIGKLDAETMAATENDRGAWVRALAREQKNVLLTLQKRTALGCYRNHGGAIGVISAIGNGDGTNDRITLTLKSDVKNFSIGMPIDVSSTDGTSGAIRTVSTQPYVGKIDFDNGYIYVLDAPGGSAVNLTTAISGSTAGDYLFSDGDFGQAFRGVDSWIPLTAPSSGESFLGIDRSVNPQTLAGHRLNDTSLSIEESIQELAARIESCGGGGDMACYMHPMQVKQLALELDTKVVRDPGGTGRFGFSGLMCDTGAGPVEVLSDPACPENRAYLLDMETWAFHHLKGLPHLVEDDGLQRVRVSTADQVEFRYRLWGNLKCTAPGRNGVFALAAAY